MKVVDTHNRIFFRCPVLVINEINPFLAKFFCFQKTERAYFLKRTRIRTRIFRKSGPYPKFTVWLKDSFLTNLRVLTSNMTIVFESSCPKIPKQGIFSPKIRHFGFFAKFCSQINSTVLISNIHQDFEILAQKYPNEVFLVPNLGIFVFFQIFAIRKT